MVNTLKSLSSFLNSFQALGEPAGTFYIYKKTQISNRLLDFKPVLDEILLLQYAEL